MTGKRAHDFGLEEEEEVEELLPFSAPEELEEELKGSFENAINKDK